MTHMKTPVTRRAFSRLAGAGLAALLAVPAMSTAVAYASPSAASQISDYVALGDSFAAGPLILPQKDLDHIAPCTRSAINYPSLLARSLDAKQFTDASCSGAVTDDIDRVSQGTSLLGTRIPPQVDRLSKDTDLVTLTIGGNDAGLVGIAMKCAYRVPSKTPCATEKLKRDARAQVDAVGSKLTRVLRAIKSRAPSARILVTSYTQYADVERSDCSNQFVNPKDIAAMQEVVSRLAEVQEASAEAVGAEYVDLITPAAGHDACSSDPWANAAQPIVNLRDFSVAFHPTAAGERAFARILADHVRESMA